MYHQLFGTMSIPWSCYLMTKAAGQSALQGPKLTKDPVFVFCSLRGLAAGGGVLASSLYLPMEDVAVDIFGVTKLLRYLVLKSHKATCPDSVPAGLLKEIAEVVPAASLILQAALDHCYIPFLLGKGTDLPDILGNETDMWNQTAPNLLLHHLL